MSLNVNDQAIVRAILTAARVNRRDITWMVESCPSVERARELYGRAHRSQQPDAHPTEFYNGVREASDECAAARRSKDEDKMTEAFARLQTEIAIAYWRIEQSNAGAVLPPLPDATVRALEALP